MSYSSLPATLFQTDPPEYLPGKFKRKSWTESDDAYRNIAKDEVTKLLRNRELGQRYRWAVSVNFEQEQTPSEIKDTWSAVALHLRRSGVIAYRAMEVTTSNLIHYHLVVASQHRQADLARIFDQSIPQGLPYHKQVQPIHNVYGYITYILKAQVAGYVGKRWSWDMHRGKRLLFVKGLPFNKVAHVGSFWLQPKAKIWADVKAGEKVIHENLERPEILRLVRYLRKEFLGDDVSRKDLERQIGLHADDDAIRRWAESLPMDAWGK